jgi:Zn-dependent protease with chaperone function
LGDTVDAWWGTEFDKKLVGQSYIELGAQADRARAIARRLNAVRHRPPKQPVLLQTTGYLAVTRRGPWVYMASGFAQRLSDDALAFVLAHEMAHHDLDHLTIMYVSAGMLGFRQQIELAADREGLNISRRAGFDPRGALEALASSGDDPEDAGASRIPSSWPPELRAHLDRFRLSHPPLEQRREALERWLASGAG